MHFGPSITLQNGVKRTRCLPGSHITKPQLSNAGLLTLFLVWRRLVGSGAARFDEHGAGVHAAQHFFTLWRWESCVLSKSVSRWRVSGVDATPDQIASIPTSRVIVPSLSQMIGSFLLEFMRTFLSRGRFF